VIHHGDCVEVMAGMEPESVDAIVTDPPYGLEFMGMAWDQFDGRVNGTPRPRNEWGDFGSREHARGQSDLHRVTRNKALALQAFSEAWAREALRVAKPGAYLLAFGGTRTVHRLACAIEDAGWIIRDTLVWAYAQGFPKSKASLKPSWEPIVMARKPGPLRELAIDACRIAAAPGDYDHPGNDNRSGPRRIYEDFEGNGRQVPPSELGRWPANVVLTDPIFDGGIEGVVGGGEAVVAGRGPHRGALGYMGAEGYDDPDGIRGYGDTGTYSRFFLLPKSDRTDREPILGIGGEAKSGERVNVHPTQP
jgi:hypothetical protein